MLMCLLSSLPLLAECLVLLPARIVPLLVEEDAILVSTKTMPDLRPLGAFPRHLSRALAAGR